MLQEKVGAPRCQFQFNLLAPLCVPIFSPRVSALWLFSLRYTQDEFSSPLQCVYVTQWQICHDSKAKARIQLACSEGRTVSMQKSRNLIPILSHRKRTQNETRLIWSQFWTHEPIINHESVFQWAKHWLMLSLYLKYFFCVKMQIEEAWHWQSSTFCSPLTAVDCSFFSFENTCSKLVAWDAARDRRSARSHGHKPTGCRVSDHFCVPCICVIWEKKSSHFTPANR